VSLGSVLGRSFLTANLTAKQPFEGPYRLLLHGSRDVGV
jgi:hypothetical protein